MINGFVNFFQIDAFPVWNAWGHALLRMEHYAQARVKFKYVIRFVFMLGVSNISIIRV